MSELRSRIQECVYHNPGIHFNELGRTLDIATGQTQHHLRRLQQTDRVKREAVCGRTHYFPPTYSAWERGAIALLRRETTREIVGYLLRNEREHPGDLADQLEIARSTVEWHLSNLIEYDLVEKTHITRDGTDRIVVEVTEPDAVYRLLREIEPGFTDRLVDRFTRLADELLAE